MLCHQQGEIGISPRQAYFIAKWEVTKALGEGVNSTLANRNDVWSSPPGPKEHG